MLIILLASFSIGFCQIQNIDELQKEINVLVKNEKEISRNIEKKLQELEKKSEKIKNIKSKESGNLLSNRKL